MSAQRNRWNLFQRAMQSWNDSMPYNAVHSISIRKSLNEVELVEAIHYSLRNCGFECRTEDIELNTIENSTNPDDALRVAFETELNRSFKDSPGTLPFRFFAIKTGETHFQLGVCYFHPVASADCICWLLEDIVSTMISEATTRRDPWLPVDTHRYRRMLLSQWRFFPRWLWKLPGFLLEAKRYARVNFRNEAPPCSRIVSLSLDESQQAWFHSKIKSTGATFNDVLISLAMFGTAKTFPQRIKHRRRKDLAIGSAINIRNLFSEAGQKTFGLYLAFFSVSHPIKDITSIDQVIRAISSKTRAIKRGRLYALNLLVIGFGNFWQRFLSDSQREQMNLKSFPLAGNTTNFFVDRFQRHLIDLPAEDYWRAVSVGPVSPLVISATTYRDRMNLMLIYNQFIYSEDDISSFSKCLESIMSSEKSPCIPVNAVA